VPLFLSLLRSPSSNCETAVLDHTHASLTTSRKHKGKAGDEAAEEEEENESGDVFSNCLRVCYNHITKWETMECCQQRSLSRNLLSLGKRGFN